MITRNQIDLSKIDDSFCNWQFISNIMQTKWEYLLVESSPKSCSVILRNICEMMLFLHFSDLIMWFVSYLILFSLSCWSSFINHEACSHLEIFSLLNICLPSSFFFFFYQSLLKISSSVQVHIDWMSFCCVSQTNPSEVAANGGKLLQKKWWEWFWSSSFMAW